MTAPAPKSSVAFGARLEPEGKWKYASGSGVANTLCPALGPPTRTSRSYSGAICPTMLPLPSLPYCPPTRTSTQASVEREYPAGPQQIGQYNNFLKNISIIGG